MSNDFFRKLLKKYMAHVTQVEGIDYLDHIGDPWEQSNIPFTEEELVELKKISQEVKEKYHV
jgi:hypothetical protein